MHSYRRARGKVLFEALCALSLAVALAGAWDQTGSSGLLASASIMALVAVYRLLSLGARAPFENAAQPAAAAAPAPEAKVETVAPEAALVREPEFVPESEPVAAAPKKPRARKARKAAAVVAPAVQELVYDGPPPEQLFDPEPYVRQARPAFGRKARGPRPVSVG